MLTKEGNFLRNLIILTQILKQTCEVAIITMHIVLMRNLRQKEFQFFAKGFTTQIIKLGSKYG